MAQRVEGDNGAMNVILGILVAVVLVAGAWFFMNRNNVDGSDINTTNNYEAPATTAPSAGTPDATTTPSNTAPAPATDGGVAP